MALERRFFMEAETFLFSVEEGKSVLRTEERWKGFLGVVLLGLQCTTWVVAAMKEALRSQGVKDFIKSFQGDSKAWIVRKGCNKDGRFLEPVVYAVAGQRGFILVPEGRGGWGWKRVVDELSKVMVFLETTYGSSLVGVLSPVEMKDGKKVLGLKVSPAKLGWGLALCGWCSTVVHGGGEVRGPCQVMGSAG
jgi:hypothetical protein